MLLKAVGRETGRVALLPGNKLNATVTGQYFSLKGCLTLLGFSGSETITQSKKRSFQTGMRPIPVCGQKGKNCPSSCPHPSCEWRGDYAPTHTHTHTRTHAHTQHRNAHSPCSFSSHRPGSPGATMPKGIFQENPLPNVNLEETTFTTLLPSVNPKK